MSRFAILAAASLFCLPALAQNRPALTGEEKAISAQMSQLRKLPDDEWRQAVGKLAKQIRQLPPGPGRERLVGSLGNLVTEGDAGRETLQTVASTMAEVLRDSPNSPVAASLARLVHYEHVTAASDNPGFRAALAKLEAEDQRRRNIEFFSLKDIRGAEWSLKALRGKVVLVNFWATWCPPCRKEMPDMETLYRRFGGRLVVLAISDEDLAKVQPFIAAQKYTFPVLLDPGRKVHELFGVEGIPASFVYDREGKLVGQAADRRTEGQFLAMLKQAGL